MCRLSVFAVALLVVTLAGCGDGDSAREDGLRTVDRRLLAAAYANDVRAARRLIDAGGDINAKDETEQSAYLIATSEVRDDPRLLELTLDAGADVNAKDHFNGTGLIRAAERGHAAIIRRLLETDIELDHVNRLGWTALLEAVILGEGGPAHIRTVRLLVNGGADVSIPDESGTTAVEHARRRGFTEIARILHEPG
jgi:ankyrin repeat protein